MNPLSVEHEDVQEDGKRRKAEKGRKGRKQKREQGPNGERMVPGAAAAMKTLYGEY